MVKVGYRFFRNIYLFYNVYIVLTHLSFIIINIDKEIRGKRKPNKKNIQIFLKKVDSIVNMLYNEKVMENMVYNYYKDNTR